MAKITKKPEILEEIFNILNNDPYLIAECLARPALVDRLIRNRYAFDERFHKEIKRKAEEDLQKFKEVGQMKLMSGKYFEVEYVLSEQNTPRPILRMGSPSPSMKGWTPKADGVVADTPLQEGNTPSLRDTPLKEGNIAIIGKEEWIELKKKLQKELIEDGRGISKLQEDENRFYVIPVLDEEIDKIRVATVEWEDVNPSFLIPSFILYSKKV